MALTRMRPKIGEVRLALEGRFDDHHTLMLSLHLGHIDQLTATIERHLAAQFRRFSRRMGKKNEGKAIFAVAHTMIVIIWHVLANNVDYSELGGDYFERRDTIAETRRHVAALQRLGHTVNLTPPPDRSGYRSSGAAAPIPRARSRASTTSGFSCQRPVRW